MSGEAIEAMAEARPNLAGRAVAVASVAVVGAGSWGTALAVHLARLGVTVRLWGRNADTLRELADRRENRRYLPGCAFPDELSVLPALEDAVDGAEVVLVAVPSHALRTTLHPLASLLTPQQRVAWATKGLEPDSAKLPHVVAREVLGTERPLAVISGPTFAGEVGRGLPTAMTVASDDPRYAADLVMALHGDNVRAYASDDVVGVGVGGAVKNVLAIGVGVSDGLGFGANARAALITRGLHEMMRLGATLGGGRETFMGLAGLGDLVLTCTDDQSRNRRMGLALAAGRGVEVALAEIGQVVEGVIAAREVWRLAHQAGVDMPITEQVYQLLHHGLPPMDAAHALSGRPPRPEHG